MLHAKVAGYSTVKFSYVKKTVHLSRILQWFCETLIKQGSSVIFGDILLQGTSTGSSVPINGTKFTFRQSSQCSTYPMVRGKNIWHYLWETDSHWQWCKGRGLEVLPLLCNTSTFTSHIFLLMNHPSKPRKLIKKSKNLFNLLRSPLHYSAGSKCCTRD